MLEAYKSMVTQTAENRRSRASSPVLVERQAPLRKKTSSSESSQTFAPPMLHYPEAFMQPEMFDYDTSVVVPGSKDSYVENNNIYMDGGSDDAAAEECKSSSGDDELGHERYYESNKTEGVCDSDQESSHVECKSDDAEATVVADGQGIIPRVEDVDKSNRERGVDVIGVVHAPIDNHRVEEERKSYEELWFIRGEYYDLSAFVNFHPGGRTILRLTQGIEDATPIMESYHSFADKEYIARTLAKYKVPYVPLHVEQRHFTRVRYTFLPDGFYATLVKRVRAHFGATSLNQSVGVNIKANRAWALKVLAQAAVFLSSYATAFLLRAKRFRTRALSAALSGVTLVALGMTLMHDACHYALGVRDSWKNKLALRVWNAISLWDPSKWLLHHTVKHHAFTGDDRLDPDTMQARPFVRKTLLSERSKYLKFPALLAAERWFWALYSVIIYALSPGMFVGQVFSHRVLWPIKGTLWHMHPVPKGAFRRYLWEDLLSLAMIGSQVYGRSPSLSFIYFTMCNATYAMCIIPDHDTYESAIENHVNGGEVDWGEVQVRNTADFGGRGLLGHLFTHMFGGINLQIGHHLFPGVSHVHMPALVPVIKATCEEFGLPFVEQISVRAALWSFVRTVQACMGTDQAPAPERKKGNRGVV